MQPKLEFLGLRDCRHRPVYQRASVSVYVELYQQANKRLHRQGQTERVIIHRLLVDGSVDHDVVAALEGKADTQEALMESIKARIEQVRKENL